MKTIIRDARPADWPTIADFNSRLAEETENRSLNPDRINPGVRTLLDDPGKGRYWIAEIGDQIVGQIMITYEWSDWRNGMLWWLQSVYIHPQHRRKGIFADLYRHVESLARADEKVCGIRLYVENRNDRAQATYETLGMHKPGYVVMEVDFSKE